MTRDDESFSRPVESHGPLVWRTLCRPLRSDDGAADCFQEPFLEYVAAGQARTAFLHRIPRHVSGKELARDELPDAHG